MDELAISTISFLTVLREGTFSRAARSLGMSQSTVSRHIAALEGTLGDQLFSRRTGVVKPTALALQLKEAAIGVEDALLSFRRLVSASGVDAGEPVRVTSPPELAQRLLAPRLEELRRSAPGLRLSLRGCNEIESLTRDVDIALRFVRPDDASLVQRRVAQLAYRLYGRPREVRRSQRRFIGYAENFAMLPEARWIEANIPLEAILYRLSPPEAVLSACRAGLGVALLPDALAEADRRLEPASETIFTRPLYLVYHRELARIPRIRTVINWLVETTSSLALAGKTATP